MTGRDRVIGIIAILALVVGTWLIIHEAPFDAFVTRTMVEESSYWERVEEHPTHLLFIDQHRAPRYAFLSLDVDTDLIGHLSRATEAELISQAVELGYPSVGRIEFSNVIVVCADIQSCKSSKRAIVQRAKSIGNGIPGSSIEYLPPRSKTNQE